MPGGAAGLASSLAPVRIRDEPFDLAHEVAEAAGVRCQVAVDATLIACGDSAAFLEACRAANVRVLSAEGFDLVDGNCRPDIGAILDLGDLDDVARSVDEARDFAAAVCRPGLVIEFGLKRG